MEKTIFDFIKPDDNEMFSHMGNKEFYKYLAYLNKYMLELRDVIGLSKDDTFGVEVEVDNFSWTKFYDLKSKNFENFSFVPEEIDYGIELVSPILTDNKVAWIKLFNLLNDLSCCSNISVNCGGHIHIGAHLLKGDIKNYINLLKVWVAYENVIFRFGYGEYLTERSNFDYFYLPIRESFYTWRLFQNWKQPFLEHKNSLNFNISYDEIKDCVEKTNNKTIEIRNPNGSLNPIIWQNNINFFVKLIKYASSDQFNESLILDRLEKLKFKLENLNNQLLYRDLDIDAALELADLIFDKNIDKVYFLRQYIKNYEVGEEKLQKGIKFTKSLNY